MEAILFLMGIVIFVCVAFQKLLNRTGVPGLFIFILLGMLFGADGLFKIEFSDYSFANNICSVALLFIMFYGGAGTKWATAKVVAVKATLLSSAGTVLTALLVGLFCWGLLGFSLTEAFLMGAVVCSTDAASVFSILRSKNLNLKYSTAPMLELESGSNDPFSYMLTVVFLTLMEGHGYGAGDIILLLLGQIIFGMLAGLFFAWFATQVLRRFQLSDIGLDTTFLVGVALMAYTSGALLHGNGYLAVYIAGIIIGNSDIPNKRNMISFLGGLTTIMQMFLFFLLGLLAFPSRLPAVAGTALAIALFLTFVARPVAVVSLLAPFRSSIRQQIFVSWAGMRGAASIVFAIMAMTGTAAPYHDIFHIVFFIVLFSILVQGTLLPFIGKWLSLIDHDGDVRKTFNDYTADVPVEFLRLVLHGSHPWAGKTLSEVTLPPESLLVLILREERRLIPHGGTVLQEGDVLILAGREGGAVSGISLYEHVLDKSDEWAGKTLAEITTGGELVMLILRNERVVIPNGATRLEIGDRLVMSR
ncbi:MAG: potassium/proton antiporter [Dialister sp.]|nr:potassium/proton antiporter [Dialister sp.]